MHPTLPAVQALRAVLVALGFSRAKMPDAPLLEQGAAALGQQAQLLRPVCLEMAATGINCRSLPSCLHGSQAEVPVH